MSDVLSLLGGGGEVEPFVIMGNEPSDGSNLSNVCAF